MPAILLPNGKQQYFTTAGAPAVGYKIATFAAGTSTPQVTWQDALKVAQNTNPVILDARGEASIFWEGAYKVQLQDAAGAPIWTQDNLQSQQNGFSASLLPAITNTVDLGSVALSWRNLYLGANNSPALDPVTGNIAYFARTAAEIAAAVTPTNFTYLPGDVRRYGADPTGVADASAAFANAFLVKGNITALGTFKIGTALTMDASNTSLTGPCVINSTIAVGQLITVTSTAGMSAPGGSEAIVKNCIRAVEFVGTNIAGVRCLYFNAVSNLIACFNLENCSFTSFDKFIEYFNNAFEITHRGCVFSQQVGTGGGCYTPAGGANYGERISFVSCAWFNNQICLKSDYPSCTYYLTQCSLDYSNQLIIMNAGWAFLNNCYVENGSTIGDLGYWFVVGTAGASLFFNHGTIVITGNKPTYEIGSSAANPGTLNITNSNLYASGNYAKAFIVAGAGNSRGHGNTVQGFANIASAWSNFSQAANFGSNGGFANGAGGLGGWTVGASAGGNPTVTPANTLSLQPTIGGNSQFAYWTLSAEVFQNVGFSCMVKGNVAAAQFGMVIRAIGADGVTIATTAVQPGFNSFNGTTFPMPTVYTQVRAVFPNLPAGTATVQLEFNTNGNTSNTNIVSIQAAYIGKY